MADQRTPHAASAAWSFPQRVLFIAVIAVLAVLAWRLMDLFVLAFGAILVATALHGLVLRLERHLRVPASLSLVVAVLLVIGAITAAAGLLGDPLGEQFSRLRERLPAALEALNRWIHTHRIGLTLLEYWAEMKGDGASWTRLAGVAGLTLGALGSLVLMVFMGIYLAAAPDLYRNGIVRLVAPAYRPRVRDALDASAAALSRWLLGQSFSMLFVGATTAIGLWVLGVPLALSVGLISGTLAFVPIFGAIAGGLLAVLVSFTEGPQTAGLVLLLCIVIQQIDNHVLMPLVQSRVVALPPVLALVSAVVFGALFGLLGVLLATPLMVVVMVLVQRLYIEGFLEGASVDAAAGRRKS